jgi:hypothetical protein
MRRALIAVALATVVLTIPSSAQLGDIFKPKNNTQTSAAGLSNDRIAAGLKEALQVSTTNAVALTGRPDGFLKNDAIHIPLPDRLKTVGRGMRFIGMGTQVAELEVGMNRAAEQATPAAKAIFLSALKKMSFDDARRILSGPDTAATDYFKKTSTADLTTAFTPIVHQHLSTLGVVRQYNAVVNGAPGGATLAANFDLDKYVVSKTLDGLFLMLGREEQKIRQNPAARTTALLQAVFGRRG